MRVRSLDCRGFRNLADAETEIGAGLTVLHVWALHVAGQNNPTGLELRTKLDSVPMSPYAVAKDIFALSVFVILFSWFVFFIPDYLGHADNYIPANPLVTPAHIVGAISLAILPFVVYARYGRQLAGRWNTVYVVGAMVALWLNAFVLIVQLFRRLPGLLATAPTQKEAPFGVTQLLVVILFVILGRAALKGSRSA